MWKKDSSIAPSLFSLIFYILGSLASLFFPFFFSLFFLFRPESHPDLWGNHSLHHPFLTWDNALIMMIITLLFTYNSILEQSMTLYECLRRCTGMGNETRVTCMKICMVALPQIRCQLLPPSENTCHQNG